MLFSRRQGRNASNVAKYIRDEAPFEVMIEPQPFKASCRVGKSRQQRAVKRGFVGWGLAGQLAGG